MTRHTAGACLAACRGGQGASPLREVVGGLRQELQERDLQLMQVGVGGTVARELGLGCG